MQPDLRSVDLHVHTYFSDGTFSPEEVMTHAKSIGLNAVAITDHDCVDAIPRARKAGAELGVEVLAGVELSAEKEGWEVHVLGYFKDDASPELRTKLINWRKDRIARAKEMVKKLNDLGLPLTYEKVEEVAQRGLGAKESEYKLVGRLHIAVALAESGLVRDNEEAFYKYIGDGKKAYVHKSGLLPEEAFELIHQSKGVAVLAHPGVLQHDDWVVEWSRGGLDGLECYHTNHNASVAEHYDRMAKKYHMLITGGSDCHGLGKSRILMGEVRMPYETLEKIRFMLGK